MVLLEVIPSGAHEDGHLPRFTVGARDVATDKELGVGGITRVVVEAERFMSRV